MTTYGPTTTTDEVRVVLAAVDMYRTNQPIAGETTLAQLGERALPVILAVLIDAMDTIDQHDAMTERVDESTDE